MAATSPCSSHQPADQRHCPSFRIPQVYRHQLKPVITKGAETMNTIFKKQVQSA
jgi:hypothetical protein